MPFNKFTGQRKVLEIVPSQATPVCAKSKPIFNEKVTAFDNAVVLVIAADLPLAMGRFYAAEGLDRVITLSTFRLGDFHEKMGVNMTSGPLRGLVARTAVVLDQNDNVLHSQLIPVIKQEPDHDAALAALAR